MDRIEFREINIGNLDEIEALRVKPTQIDLVAENIYSIAQSGLDFQGWCRAVYLGETPVAFFYIRDLEEGKLAYICRFMVDQAWQSKGIGKQIMSELVTLLFSAPLVETIDLAVSSDSSGAMEFYRKCGFISTEEPYRGGVRMVLERSVFQAR